MEAAWEPGGNAASFLPVQRDPKLWLSLARYVPLPAGQQDSLRRALCAVRSQKVRAKQEVPTSTFSSTHAPPWGNECTLQQGWTIFIRAATPELTLSAISPHPPVPLARSIPPSLTTAEGAECLWLSWVTEIPGLRPGGEVHITHSYFLSPAEV